MIEDFASPRFRRAFQSYFQELGIQVRDWDGLFREMDTDSRGTRAIVRAEGERTVGFIQFCPIEFSSWFFTKGAGFVREFWVAPEFRGKGHGKALLGKAESWFQSQGLGLVLLTTDTASGFYERLGYRPDRQFQAKNQDMVYRKEI